MTTVLLKRLKTVGKAVYGEIVIPIAGRELTYPTLENADFIIPAGTYPLKLTWSPKFKKLLPLIDEVPEREGIRIHQGIIPEHSQGCVLVRPLALSNLQVMFNYINKFYEDEKVQIQITDGPLA